MDDIDVLECARYLSYLDPWPPVTSRMDQWGSMYANQREHMCKWVKAQLEVHSGPYGRRTPNHSTKVMYNRFQNPGGLLWMAEALGEKGDVLRRAVAAAVEAERKAAKFDGKSRCRAFRSVIPWERIAELFSNPGGWRIDCTKELLLDRDDKGYPIPKPRKKHAAAIFARTKPMTESDTNKLPDEWNRI